VGYVTGRRIDARLAVASLRRGIALRRPLPGCVVHADRGSRYAPELHRDLLKAHGVVGSLGRRGPPHDTPQAESLRKTSKVEDASLAASETFEGVALGLPRFLDAYAETRLHSAPG
jgi:putative transposase